LSRAAALPAALAAALGAGCAHTPAPRHPRPPLAAAAAAAVPALPAATTHELRADGARVTGCLHAGDERVRFEVRTHEGLPPRAVVLLVPILAGGAELLDQIALRVQAHGFDVAFCARPDGAMKVGQRGEDLDALFARTLLHQRLLLRWLREHHAPGAPQFAFGISLGGMVATVLAAQEPRLAGAALCLCGGDVATLVVHSSEPRVRRWYDWRVATDGVGADAIVAELEQRLHHEPLRHAPAIDTREVLLVQATLDSVVPHRHHQLLWEALGRPARYTVPLGHYSAVLAMVAGGVRYGGAAGANGRGRRSPCGCGWRGL
jgi:alpha-beta hydrolase superfamily lysophospholipase